MKGDALNKARRQAEKAQFATDAYDGPVSRSMDSEGYNTTFGEKTPHRRAMSARGNSIPIESGGTAPVPPAVVIVIS
jgi:hypothetical protein